MKFCVDCKYYVENARLGAGYARCAKKPNLVTGQPGAFCDIERAHRLEGYCGVEGHYWEPQEAVVIVPVVAPPTWRERLASWLRGRGR